MIPIPFPHATIALRPLFSAPQLGFVVDAMQTGNSPATAWVDDAQQPRSAFMWDTTHSLYLGGDAGNGAFIGSLRGLLAETILPHGRDHHLGIFKIYTADETWAALVPDLFQKADMPTRARCLFRLDPRDDTPENAPLPPEFRVEQITRELLNNRQNVDRLLDEIGSCWTALDRFWSHGFGFCALDKSGAIAGWCTAEYVGNHVCGVGIETIEEHQGKGVGTTVAGAFVQHCCVDGWTAHWDSWQSNTPSVRVAEKIGFRKVTDYAVQIYVFDD